jgi:hypothetical protein
MAMETRTRFESKSVGDIEDIQGFDTATNTPYFLWGMKEPDDYIMRIMATGGASATNDTCKTAHYGIGKNDCISFSYTKPYGCHFCYRHIADDHNNLDNALSSLEAT